MLDSTLMYMTKAIENIWIAHIFLIKNRWKHTTVIVVTIICFTCLSCSENNSSKTLFLAHSLPETHPVHQGILDFKKELEKISGGNLKVKVFPNGQLGSEREVLELLQIGSIAITKVSTNTMANFAPKYGILSAPYLFKGKTHFFEVLESEIGEEILESSSNFLLKGLCYYDAGSRSFYTKDRPVRTPEDLQGLKIRVMNHQLSIDLVQELGGSATPMSFGELYTALQQGVVDGAENNPPSFVSSNHFEVCKYYTLDEHSSAPDILVISTKSWNSLRSQQQGWVKKAAKISAQTQKEYWKASVEKCMKILEENDVEIIRPNKSLFRTKSAPLLTQLAKEPEMSSIIQKIQSYKQK
ncbi:TRAP transporter substrate-binding protein [Reichenbachiella sp.]|uniref:TRAP transporter substrate-binding protein n=2 Tax=Reichenbachiella sp. TaxID=2184521 RepID=UPI003298987A